MRRPVDTPEDADRAAEAARVLGELLRVEDQARDLLQEARRREVAPRPPSDLSGLPLHEAALRVLREVGYPLPAHQLGVFIYSRGWRHPRAPYRRPDRIVRHLAARLGKHPELFERVGPNTFALTEWAGSPPGLSRPPPRGGLFSGPGTGIARLIGDRPDLPFTEGRGRT